MTRQTGTCAPAASHGNTAAWLHDPLVITFDEPSRGGDVAGPRLTAPFIPNYAHFDNSREPITVIDESLSMRR